MINAVQLREHIVRPTLQAMCLHSDAAENLVMGTAATESKLGTWIVQSGGGPALGIYQCEPATHIDLWQSWLRYRPEIANWLHDCVGNGWWDETADRPRHGALVSDLRYATAICRLCYRRVSEPLPEADDWAALGRYWKRHYNTSRGKGTVEHWMGAVRDTGVADYRQLTGRVGE